MQNRAIGDMARGQAIADAGGVAPVVAAMRQHVADAELQRHGCGALQNLAVGDAARKRAIVKVLDHLTVIEMSVLLDYLTVT